MTTPTRIERTGYTIAAKPGELSNALVAAHQRLECLARGVADSIRDDDRDCMHDDYAAFERQLLDHLDWEDMYLLPRFEDLDPQAADTIRRDHARFRKTLGEIGIEIDLHIVRAERFDEFARDLASHSEFEDVMYREVATTTYPEHSTLLRQYSKFTRTS